MKKRNSFDYSSNSLKICIKNQSTNETYRIVIGLCHNIGNLSPSHTIFECSLIGFRLHCFHMRIKIGSCNIIEDWTAGHFFLLLIPTSTPHHQANQCECYNEHGDDRSTDRNGQNVTINFTLAAIEAICTDAHQLTATVIILTCSTIVAVRIRTWYTFTAGSLSLIGPWIS